jgi:hypothetical protein
MVDSVKNKRFKRQNLFSTDPKAFSYEMTKSGDALGKPFNKLNPRLKQFLSVPEVRCSNDD